MQGNQILRRDRLTGLAIVNIFVAAISMMLASAVSAYPDNCNIEAQGLDEFGDIFVECNGNATSVSLTASSASSNVTFHWSAPSPEAFEHPELDNPYVIFGSPDNATTTVTLLATDAFNDPSGIFDACVLDFYVQVTVSDATSHAFIEDCAVTILVQDLTAPTIDCPGVFQVPCDGMDNEDAFNTFVSNAVEHYSCTAVDVIVDPTYSALPSGCGSTGSYPVTIMATDKCGRSTICHFTYKILPSSGNPTINCPIAQDRECDGTPFFTALTDWIAANDAVAINSCPVGTVSVTHQIINPTFPCANTGSATIVFTATDGCQHSATCTTTFIVRDTKAPIVTPPTAMTIQCDNHDHTAEFNAWLLTASATDACGTATMNTPCTTTVYGCSGTYVKTTSFTAHDACGNVSLPMTSTFTVIDNTGPVISAPEPNKTIPFTTSAQLTNALNAWLGSFTALDTCTGAHPIVHNNFTSLDNTCSDQAGATVTFTATDACLNPSTAMGTFSVTPSVVVVDQSVVVNLNTSTPTYTGDPDLLPYFTYDRSGLTADTWKVIFDVGYSKLRIINNATITVTDVPATGNNRRSPGIVIRSNRDFEIAQGSAVIVDSMNMEAGDILIHVFGDVTVSGSITNVVVGTNGTPGRIDIATGCGDIITGPKSRIETSGVDHGGSDIRLISCGPGSVVGGDIFISGMVHAFHKYDHTPTIDIISLDGKVTIDGNNDFGDEVVGGTTIHRNSGVLVETSMATSAGDINIQAFGDIKVIGNVILNRNRIQYGAVAVKPHSTNGQGGDGDITAISVNGKIIASDRAFDFENRFNALNAITLLARGDICLNASNTPNDVAAGQDKYLKLVVNSDGGSGTPSQGGTNTLRSFNGTIVIGANARVSASHGPVGLNGSNVFFICPASINNINAFVPAATPNYNACSTTMPTPVFSILNCDTCVGF